MDEQTRNKVVVTTVGTGRDRDDIAGAIVFSLRQQQATRAVFLCSSKTRDETLPLVLHELGWTETQYRTHVCSTEDDVQALFIEWNRQWDGWLKSWMPAEIVVDFTSGTKPMSAAAVLLAVARQAHALSYIVGERDETGRVVRSTGVQRISPDLVIAHRQLRLAVEHFHAGDYAAAGEIAGRYRKIDALPDDHLREVARSIDFIARAYAAWDRFDYKAAAATLRESKHFWPWWAWVVDAERLKANDTLVNEVKDAIARKDFGPAIAADLLANAERCIARQRWDDAVARLYRACELLAQSKLARDHDQRTNDIDPARLPERLRAEYEERKNRAYGGKLKLGLYEAYRLLEQLGEPLGREFCTCYGDFNRPGPLKSLLDTRNNSLLAHGLDPIKKDKARDLQARLQRLADVADPAILRDWQPKADTVRFDPF